MRMPLTNHQIAVGRAVLAQIFDISTRRSHLYGDSILYCTVDGTFPAAAAKAEHHDWYVVLSATDEIHLKHYLYPGARLEIKPNELKRDGNRDTRIDLYVEAGMTLNEMKALIQNMDYDVDAACYTGQLPDRDQLVAYLESRGVETQTNSKRQIVCASDWRDGDFGRKGKLDYLYVWGRFDHNCMEQNEAVVFDYENNVMVVS